jgi:hypothetical protein
MNTQQTIEMARQHGTPVQEQNSDVEYLFSVDQIERLLAAECEACAKAVESIPLFTVGEMRQFEKATLDDAAKQIRKRSIK